MKFTILKRRNRVLPPIKKSFVMIYTAPKIKPARFEHGWWMLDLEVDDDCPAIPLENFIHEIQGWQSSNCDGKYPFDYRYAKQGRYFAFRKEEDAMLCYVKFGTG